MIDELIRDIKTAFDDSNEQALRAACALIARRDDKVRRLVAQLADLAAPDAPGIATVVRKRDVAAIVRQLRAALGEE